MLSQPIPMTYDTYGKPDTQRAASEPVLAYDYDGIGRMTFLTDQEGSLTSLTYDEISRLTGMTDPNNFNISYPYNEAGNLGTLTYPGNKTVTYTYDDLNRIETVTDWLDRTATYNYDDAGRLTSMTQLIGTVVAYDYDNASRLTDLENLTAQGAGAIAAYHFTLDDNGNRIDVDQDVPIAIDLSALSMGFTTNNTKNRLLSAGSDSFTYDDEGQLQSAYGNTLSFDPKHRLTQISGTVNSQYQYDGFGNRLEAIRNGVTTRYIYGASGNLLAEADANGDIQQYYIYGAGLLALVTPDNSLYSYHFNGTGHTVAMTDINKNIVNKYAYSPFGTIGDQEEAVAQPFKFVGQFGVMTEANGWYYMRARYYDPAVGRFISEDPIGFDGGDVNLYGYVLNNPVNLVDPDGLVWFRPKGAPYYVGRDGTVVEPGKGIGKVLENIFPAMHDMGYLHDDMVTSMRANGLPDWLVNKPSMPIAYTAAFIGNLFGYSYTTYGERCPK